ncbi:hypothetical protein RI367_006376 [Sorochytrium milnesiophthora]
MDSPPQHPPSPSDGFLPAQDPPLPLAGLSRSSSRQDLQSSSTARQGSPLLHYQQQQSRTRQPTPDETRPASYSPSKGSDKGSAHELDAQVPLLASATQNRQRLRGRTGSRDHINLNDELLLLDDQDDQSGSNVIKRRRSSTNPLLAGLPRPLHLTGIGTVGVDEASGSSSGASSSSGLGLLSVGAGGPLPGLNNRMSTTFAKSRRTSVMSMDVLPEGEQLDNAEWELEGAGRRVKYEDFSTIDWIHDFAKERIRLKRLHEIPGFRGRIASMFDASQAWIVVALVGVISGLIASFIAITEQWLSDLKLGYCRTDWYLNKKFCCWGEDEEECSAWASWSEAFNIPSSYASGYMISYFFFVLLATTFTLLSAIMVKHLAPYAAGSGIPEIKTILGGFVMRRFLGGWTLLVKCIGLPLATASGLSLGKEGPLVHVACCVGNIVPRLFPKFAKNEAKKREILSAAAAAGISCAFGAPIGGVLFSLEEVSYYFPYKTMLRSFFSAMMAAVTLQVMNPFRTGKLVLFQVTYDKTWHSFELLFFVLIGILGGLFGALFIRLNLKIVSLRKFSWLKPRPIQEACVIAVITGLVSYGDIFLRVDSSELLSNLFKECHAEDRFYGICDRNQFETVGVLLILAALAKMILTTVTFGIRVPCGLFIPSMCIGACVGRIVAMGADIWQSNYPHFFLFKQCRPEQPCITLGPYALLGASAFLTGVTRTTVSLVIMMFEVTGALTYVLPIMITIMTAKFVADAFGKDYPFLDNREEYSQSTSASHVMTGVDDLTIIAATGHTVDSLEALLAEGAFMGFPVVASLKNLQMVGYISRNELKYALDQARRRSRISGSTPCYFIVDHTLLDPQSIIDLTPWMDQTPFTVVPKFPMEMTVELFKKMGLRYVLITRNGQLLGLITKKDVLRHLGRLTETMHRRELFQNPEDRIVG